MRDRRNYYDGSSRWCYHVGPRGVRDVVVLPVPSGNYAEDEMMARHLVRLKLKLKRLPAGTRFYPEVPIS